MKRSERREYEKIGDWGLGYVVTRALAVVAVIALIAVGIWLIKVQTAGVRGEGNAIQSREAAPNRIEAQEQFHQRYQEILAADRNIGAAKIALDAEPANPNRKTEYQGLVTFCNDLVGRYNADARAFTREQFRDADLPAQIDLINPETDCKEPTR